MPRFVRLCLLFLLNSTSIFLGRVMPIDASHASERQVEGGE